MFYTPEFHDRVYQQLLRVNSTLNKVNHTEVHSNSTYAFLYIFQPLLNCHFKLYNSTTNGYESQYRRNIFAYSFQ